MNFKSLAFALLASFLIISCGTDDMKMEEQLNPSFRASLDWQEGIKTDISEFLGPEHLDSLPSDIDITWTETAMIDPETFELRDAPGSTAFAFKNPEFDDTNFISAFAVNGTDTTFVFFFVGGEFEVGSYEYATLDILDVVFSGDEFVLPPKTIIPFIGRIDSQVGAFLSFAFFEEEVDFADSSFDITKVDTETKEISGNFKIDASIVTEDEGKQPFLKVEDGNFVKVPIIQ